MVEQYGKTQDVSDQRNMLWGFSFTQGMIYTTVLRIN